MCGIIGYTGQDHALDYILSGMKCLTYRGYDSNGLVVRDDEEFQWSRQDGNLEAFLEQLEKSRYQGKTGMGHTRWATHGVPSIRNAHPQFDCHHSIAVVHNGIIENFRSLKDDLEAKGHTFRSDTDTEVLPHLLEDFIAEGRSTEEAIKSLIDRIDGSYAIAVMTREEPDVIYGMSKKSPLVAGIGKNAHFLASDIPALLEFTREIVVMEDEEFVKLRPDQLSLYSPGGEPIERASRHIDWEAEQARKEGYKHYMKKEIFEQPQALRETFGGRLLDDGNKLDLGLAPSTKKRLEEVQHIHITACGTSYYAGLLGQYFLEQISEVSATVSYASEFRYSPPPIGEDTMFLAISQSGETADTLAALAEARENGAFIMGVCNIMGSSLTREADETLYTRAGLEVGVAATKTFITQVAVLFMLALRVKTIRSSRSQNENDEDLQLLRELHRVPEQIEEVLDLDSKIRDIARQYKDVYNYMFLGRRYNYPTALEGALKLKEISYIHAEGYAGGEMKHGPLALVDDTFPTVVIAPQDEVYSKMVSNMQEIVAREGILIGIVEEGDEKARNLCQHYIEVPSTTSCISPMINTIPVQLLAYHMGDLRGCDVDQPRNLAKTVTVE